MPKYDHMPDLRLIAFSAHAARARALLQFEQEDLESAIGDLADRLKQLDRKSSDFRVGTSRLNIWRDRLVQVKFSLQSVDRYIRDLSAEFYRRGYRAADFEKLQQEFEGHAQG